MFGKPIEAEITASIAWRYREGYTNACLQPVSRYGIGLRNRRHSPKLHLEKHFRGLFHIVISASGLSTENASIQDRNDSKGNTMQLKDSFIGNDTEGHQITILVVRDTVNSKSSKRRRAHKSPSAFQELQTTDGRRVIRIERGTYEVVGHPNIRITSKDRNAP